MRTVVLLAAIVLVSGACAAGEADRMGQGLPFYDSPDFSPRGTDMVDHAVGAFALVTQTGAPLTDRDLYGHIHVASFIYAHCAGICPTMVQRLKEVQSAIATRPDVLLVSYSVTPALDSPDA